MSSFPMLMFVTIILCAERICWAAAPHRGGKADPAFRGLPGAAKVAALQAGREGAEEDKEKD